MTDPGYMLLIAVVMTFLFILSQRLENKRGFRIFIAVTYAILLARGNLLQETILGFAIALFISFLFWLLIGRYNPPKSAEIKVFGMDD